MSTTAQLEVKQQREALSLTAFWWREETCENTLQPHAQAPPSDKLLSDAVTNQ